MRRARRNVVLFALLPCVLALGQVLPGATAAGPRVPVREPVIRALARVVTPPGRTSLRPGEQATVAGALRDRANKPVAGTFTLQVTDPNGRVLASLPGRTADDGTFRAVVPGTVTRGVKPTRDSHWTSTLAVRVVDVRSGSKAEPMAGATPLAVSAPPTGLELHNDFTSAVGWVKPGEAYPFRVLLRNYTAGAIEGGTVTLSEVEGMRFTAVRATHGTAAINAGTITWTVGSVPAKPGDSALPTVATLVVQARADSTAEDAKVVWRDLSTTATHTYGEGTQTSTAHGPKVIPPDELYDTARYGDRPFPVVPVDYVDRKHTSEHTADVLARKINAPAVAGSTFNLFQENSYGQLYPHGTVPSVGIATAPFPDEKIDFADPKPNGVCPTPVTLEDAQGQAAYSERIKNGWYQLPGTTEYYGLDRFGPQSAIAGSLSGQAILFDIDSACGPTAKAVYDAAAISDPEIDYSDFDTDKDGVVDFFMMVFVGAGGHGGSLTGGYDNIWPHSSSLEFTYTDEATGLTGYVSKDQLKDLEGRPLWYTNEQRAQMTTTDMGDELKVPVRVGPYNVNPETAIDKASVISHEYGHSLGLPDFYSTGDRETYGDWNLMATDKSQNMDVFSKQDMGWIVPRVLPKGTTKVKGWRDSKVNTHRIDWVTPDGKPYSHTGPAVANGEAYTTKLKGRQLISPEKVAQGASPSHVWWSGSGNDFGCPPERGHNFDISLPQLERVPAGSVVKLEFASYWDIEWDYDYGFVLISPNRGETYVSVPSEKGYTTPSTQNPNANQCQARYGNGITGTSGSYANGTAAVDRVAAVPGSTNYPDGPFLPDSYDISALAGTPGAVIRFAYATDPGLAHPGWFIDNLKVTVDGEPLYESDFESLEKDRPVVFNGGCQESLKVATRCTRGWQYISSDVDSTADHGYYMEMRDRSGFDFNGKNENDREAIAFAPGMLLVYTDETHGYGNAGTDDPPAQSPLDANPTPGDLTPQLNDAAFVTDNEFSDAGWVDNYEDPNTESENWEFRFNCLKFKVDAMSGEDVGPDSPPMAGGDLVGDVTFTTTNNCVPFNYGYSAQSDTRANTAPTARFAIKPGTAVVGQEVAFDASESSDDRQAPPDLTYAWDFGDGSTGTGRNTTHTYTKAGRYTVTLSVKDADGAEAKATRVMQVGNRSTGNVGTNPGGNAGGGGTTPATGANELLALLAIAGSAAAVLLRRRAARA